MAYMVSNRCKTTTTCGSDLGEKKGNTIESGLRTLINKRQRPHKEKETHNKEHKINKQSSSNKFRT